MKKNITSTSLVGKILIAMPQMTDPRFANSVIFMCGHDAAGAMGIIVNRLVESLSFSDLLNQLNLKIPAVEKDIRVHFGGPVEMGRGFVLHSNDYLHESSVKIGNDFVLTATTDVLQEISAGAGPKHSILALGYAGWGAGQLEAEINKNSWLEIEADEDLVFNEDLESCWARAVAKIGIDPAMLSIHSGHA